MTRATSLLTPLVPVVLLAFLAHPATTWSQNTSGAPYPRPAGSHDVVVERAVMVSMRDGVRLATDIYRPKDVSGPLPTSLIRTPYNKSANPAGDGNATFFASHG